jgi:hypothetical protein
MKYNQAILHLGDDEYEEMVVSMCQSLLGIGVTSFAKGKDGGKDAKFNGPTSFPGKSNPWNGKIIIQAKHTSNPVASCSDNDFFGNKKCIINEEIERLQKLKALESIDYYLMFTNRKYSGGADQKILAEIANRVEIDESKVFIAGNQTTNTFLERDHHTVNKFRLDIYSFPFDFSDFEIKELIIAFERTIDEEASSIQIISSSVKNDFLKISDKEKNGKNKLSESYYQQVVLMNSLPYFSRIDDFLKKPSNRDLKNLYFDTISELQQLILLKRNNFVAFEEVFIFISKIITSKNESLIGKKRFVTVFLHYMYHTCSIGIK